MSDDESLRLAMLTGRDLLERLALNEEIVSDEFPVGSQGQVDSKQRTLYYCFVVSDRPFDDELEDAFPDRESDEEGDDS